MRRLERLFFEEVFRVQKTLFLWTSFFRGSLKVRVEVELVNNMVANVGNYDKGFRFMVGLIFFFASVLPFVDKEMYLFMSSLTLQVIIFGILTLYSFATFFLAFDPLYVIFKINTVGAKPK